MSARPDFQALGRRGGLTTAATRDMRKVAAHARRNAPNNIEYFFAVVDPDGTLDKSDRAARARAAQKLYFSSLAKRRTNEKKARTDERASFDTDPRDWPSRVRPSQ